MKLHHIGYIIKDIAHWEKNMIYQYKVKEIYDPIQNAHISLYNNFSDTLIELIQPINNKSFTWNSLQRNGNHYHHICYKIDSLRNVYNISEKHGLIKLREPLPAILFDNKLVTFYYTRNKQIVEFLITGHED